MSSNGEMPIEIHSSDDEIPIEIDLMDITYVPEGYEINRSLPPPGPEQIAVADVTPIRTKRGRRRQNDDEDNRRWADRRGHPRNTAQETVSAVFAAKRLRHHGHFKNCTGSDGVYVRRPDDGNNIATSPRQFEVRQVMDNRPNKEAPVVERTENTTSAVPSAEVDVVLAEVEVQKYLDAPSRKASCKNSHQKVSPSSSVVRGNRLEAEKNLATDDEVVFVRELKGGLPLRKNLVFQGNSQKQKDSATPADEFRAQDTQRKLYQPEGKHSDHAKPSADLESVEECDPIYQVPACNGALESSPALPCSKGMQNEEMRHSNEVRNNTLDLNPDLQRQIEEERIEKRRLFVDRSGASSSIIARKTRAARHHYNGSEGDGCRRGLRILRSRYESTRREDHPSETRIGEGLTEDQNSTHRAILRTAANGVATDESEGRGGVAVQKTLLEKLSRSNEGRIQTGLEDDMKAFATTRDLIGRSAKHNKQNGKDDVEDLGVTVVAAYRGASSDVQAVPPPSMAEVESKGENSIANWHSKGANSAREEEKVASEGLREGKHSCPRSPHGGITKLPTDGAGSVHYSKPTATPVKLAPSRLLEAIELRKADGAKGILCSAGIAEDPRNIGFVTNGNECGIQPPVSLHVTSGEPVTLNKRNRIRAASKAMRPPAGPFNENGSGTTSLDPMAPHQTNIRGGVIESELRIKTSESLPQGVNEPDKKYPSSLGFVTKRVVDAVQGAPEDQAMSTLRPPKVNQATSPNGNIEACPRLPFLSETHNIVEHIAKLSETGHNTMRLKNVFRYKGARNYVYDVSVRFRCSKSGSAEKCRASLVFRRLKVWKGQRQTWHTFGMLEHTHEPDVIKSAEGVASSLPLDPRLKEFLPNELLDDQPVVNKQLRS